MASMICLVVRSKLRRTLILSSVAERNIEQKPISNINAYNMFDSPKTARQDSGFSEIFSIGQGIIGVFRVCTCHKANPYRGCGRAKKRKHSSLAKERVPMSSVFFLQKSSAYAELFVICLIFSVCSLLLF